MQRDEVGAGGLIVGDLVDIQVLGGAHETLGQSSRARLENAAFLGHFKDGFGGLTADDANGAGGATVIVNRTALPASPTKDERVVSGAGVHEVAAVALR